MLYSSLEACLRDAGISFGELFLYVDGVDGCGDTVCCDGMNKQKLTVVFFVRCRRTYIRRHRIYV